MKTRYKFMGRSGGIYYWESVHPVSPGDSRHEQVYCSVSWFWGKARSGWPYGVRPVRR